MTRGWVSRQCDREVRGRMFSRSDLRCELRHRWRHALQWPTFSSSSSRRISCCSCTPSSDAIFRASSDGGTDSQQDCTSNEACTRRRTHDSCAPAKLYFSSLHFSRPISCPNCFVNSCRQVYFLAKMALMMQS